MVLGVVPVRLIKKDSRKAQTWYLHRSSGGWFATWKSSVLSYRLTEEPWEVCFLWIPCTGSKSTSWIIHATTGHLKGFVFCWFSFVGCSFLTKHRHSHKSGGTNTNPSFGLRRLFLHVTACSFRWSTQVTHPRALEYLHRPLFRITHAISLFVMQCAKKGSGRRMADRDPNLPRN